MEDLVPDGDVLSGRALGALLVLGAIGAVGCRQRDALVVVTVDSTGPLDGIASLHGSAMAGGRTSALDLSSVFDGGSTISIPPARMFGILVPASIGGAISVEIEASDASGRPIASGSGTGTVTAGQRSDIAITFGSGMDFGLDLGAGDSASGCVSACSDPSTLLVCGGDGGSTAVACALGCSEVGGAHCRLFYPSGQVTRADLTVAGVTPISFTSTTAILHSDTGAIDGARPANADPAVLEIQNGIAFHKSGNVGIFIFGGLTVAPGAAIKLVGANPIALVSNADVTVAGLIQAGPTSSGTCGAQPGPGGGAGGVANAGATTITPAMGPGAGGSGTAGTSGNFTSGGGGGHGASGGAGGSGVPGAGGLAGPAYDNTTLNPLLGGSGGGASGSSSSCGGAGGGGVQLVAVGTITVGGDAVVGGITAGGGGAVIAGGGGSGGAVLAEALTIRLLNNGGIAVNGGGGGGYRAGASGGLNMTPAAGGTAATGFQVGGAGGAAGAVAGGPGLPDSSGGGGAVGRIRLNTLSGAASFAGNAFLSPSEGDVNALSQHVATEGTIDLR